MEKTEKTKNNTNMKKGILYTMLSALMFGVAPILAKGTYSGGSNGINTAFLRGLLSLPILYIILRKNGVNIMLTKNELKQILLVAVFGTAATTNLLYMAYGYISVGMATTIHFIYPIAVILINTLFFKEKISKTKIIALILASFGVLTFLDFNSKNGIIGIAMAVLSGLTYAYYIIFIEKTELKNMYFFKLSFYLCIVMVIESGIVGGILGNITFDLSLKAWIYSFLVSICTSVGAVTLLNLGIKYSGASTAAILCTLEPITSVILGILILGESISLSKIIGIVFILGSVMLINISGIRGSLE